MKILLLTLFLVGAFGLLEACSENCEPRWWKFRGQCYRFFNNKVDWQTAERNCIAEGGNLVSIHSEEENRFVFNLIKTDNNHCNLPPLSPVSNCWMGFKRVTPTSDNFVWSDASAKDFTKWNNNEPSNRNGNEGCTVFRTDGTWNDVPCDAHLAYICKKSP